MFQTFITCHFKLYYLSFHPLILLVISIISQFCHFDRLSIRHFDHLSTLSFRPFSPVISTNGRNLLPRRGQRFLLACARRNDSALRFRTVCSLSLFCNFKRFIISNTLSFHALYHFRRFVNPNVLPLQAVLFFITVLSLQTTLLFVTVLSLQTALFFTTALSLQTALFLTLFCHCKPPCLLFNQVLHLSLRPFFCHSSHFILYHFTHFSLYHFARFFPCHFTQFFPCHFDQFSLRH